jgi:hypothetical protein
MASINYLINRLHTCPTTNQGKTRELETIKKILHNNQYKCTHRTIKENGRSHKKQESTRKQRTKKLAMPALDEK